jgi:hypothetical protein
MAQRDSSPGSSLISASKAGEGLRQANDSLRENHLIATSAEEVPA